jgi:N-acetylmuramoyl-L-alanine amidase
MALACVVAAGSSDARAQDVPELRVERADGQVSAVRIGTDRGYAVVPLRLFEEIGWSVGSEGESAILGGPDGLAVSLRVGTPFFRWNGRVAQLADAPYREADGLRVPLQLLSDFLPRRLPELYAFDGASLTLQAADPADWSARPPAADSLAGVVSPTPDTARTPSQEEAGPAEAELRAPSPYVGPRVVVIDAGHGGGDPGALGLGGVREKAVALGIARALAAQLEGEADLEVHMTRSKDSFVPIWDRGEQAMRMKGDHPGIFISIHANSFPSRRSARGFETYFLSEARTEHERRVAANENAPLRVQGEAVDPDKEPDLGFILRELRNLDQQHWSSLLAEMVQQEMAVIHPGPNRGVKQGVLAVLTNSLMPSVLVEVGYLSNPDEADLLGRRSFQEDAARAIAKAVTRFFERYPPESGNRGEGP